MELNTELAFIYNEATGTLHCAELVDEYTDMRHCISIGGAIWATKCRCELVKTSFKIVYEVPSTASQCRRKACVKNLKIWFD